MVKKLGFFSLILFLLFLLAVVALPVWMPLALDPILKRFGVEYDSYDKIGYARFSLNDVAYSKDQVQVQAERVEAWTPTAWLWQRWRGNDELGTIAVGDWRVEIGKKEEERPTEEGSLYEVFEEIENLLPTIADWVPRARLGEGELIIPGRTIEVEGATWQDGILTAGIFDPDLEQAVVLEGDLRGGLPIRLTGKSDPFPLRVELVIGWVEERLAIGGEANFAGNILVAEAEFPREGYWPEKASVKAEDFQIPGEYLELEGYEDIVGSLLFDWQEGQFTADLRGAAEPVEDQTQLPPLRVDASARGDLESFVVETLEVQSPWLVATLSDPVALDYGGELLTEESVFQLAADLAGQPFAAVRGEVRGEIRVSPGEERLPIIDFDLTGDGLAGYDLELERVELKGHLIWPDLAVADLVVEGVEESRLVATANINLDTKEISDGSIAGDVRPEWVGPWLPKDYGFATINLAGEFEGPFEELRHRGHLEAEQLLIPKAHPLNGLVEWEGEMENLSDLTVELIAGAGRLTVAGSTELEKDRLEVNLRQMRLERDGQPLFESVAQSRLLLEWAEEAPLVVSLEDLHWAGEGREIVAAAAIAWPERGTFSVQARGLSTDLLRDFLDLERGFVSLSSADLEGAWTDGPLEFDALAELRLEVGDADEVLIEVNARGEGEELKIERLRATNQGEVLVVAEGILPVAISPGHDQILDVQEKGRIDFRAETSPQARFWEQFGNLTGVFLEDPRLSLEVTGTPYEPAGHISGSAPLVNLRAFQDEERPLPVVTDLRLETVFGEDHLSIREFGFYIEGQRVELEANLPMGTREWRDLIQENNPPDWKQATGRVTIQDAEVAAFTRFAPAVLSPQGRLQANVRILPGGLLDGVVTLEEAATRPIMPFGSIQEGTARLLLRNRTVEIEEISAVVGGERVTVTGTVDLPFEQPFGFEVNINGRNLPLTRRAGVVIRGDLNLSAKALGDEVPTISGRVDLHDSFYFAHIRVMPSGAVATPERRPPFFSIEEEPFNEWKLNVELRGPSFLDVRGPIFQGTVSANFNLSGTLEEPRAIGAATLESGRVRFPFASLTIDQGEVALRRENPFQPQLFIVASGMAFGYDLRMEITGTAETPIIEFFSNPPLTSEQALLMVTTGELPREEIKFSTQQRASRFAIYFGQNLLYELTGDDSASDRLVIRSGEQVSEGGRETMTIEYRLSDSWSVLGEYDRFDEYNVGLKWNIFSR